MTKKKKIGKPSVLYLDDKKADLTFFESALDDVYRIFIAQNKNEAFKILAKDDIHVFITDYLMPDANGIEILEHVYKSYPHIIRIIITAYNDLRIIEQAVNKGSIHGFLHKPLNIEHIKSKLRLLLFIIGHI